MIWELYAIWKSSAGFYKWGIATARTNVRRRHYMENPARKARADPNEIRNAFR